MERRAPDLALATQEVSRAEASKRRSAAESLLRALELAGLTPDPVRTVTPPAGVVPGYLRLPVVLPNGISGFPSVRRANALGMGGGYPGPLTELVPLQPLHVGVSSVFPGAERLIHGLVTLPTHSLMRGRDRERIVREMECYRI